MKANLRDFFDQLMDQVLAEMPEQVHKLLDEVTMYVDDYPAPPVLQKLGIADRRQLCGLYTGIPLGQRSVAHSGVLSDAIHIYREGIIGLASDRWGNVDADRLRRQIRITVLHELGHHFGIGERELRELGYG